MFLGFKCTANIVEIIIKMKDGFKFLFLTSEVH